MNELNFATTFMIIVFCFVVLCPPGGAVGNNERQTPMPITYSLDGDWRLRPEPVEIDWRTRYWEDLSNTEALGSIYDDSDWLITHVPGYVQFDTGLKNRWWGYDLYRVNFKPWIYRKVFSVPAGFQDRRVALKFNGVQYWSVVWLNGRKIGRHEGYFAPFTFDVTDDLNYEGANTLVVAVTNPWSWRQEGTDKNTIQGLLENWDAKPFDLLPMGIWQPVKLIAHEGLIDRVQVDADAKPDHRSAKVGLKVWMLERGNADRVRFEIFPIGFKPRGRLPNSIEVALSKSGEGSASANVTIDDPELWWTWDQGKPNLYTLKVTALANGAPVHVREVNFGIRSVRLEMKMDSGVFYLNGRKVFLRGANLMPDQYPGLVDAKRLKDLMRLAKEANLNLIRLHAHVNPPFYEACDSVGILAWSDFPLIWSYQDDPDSDIVERAIPQYREYIAMLRNHPSIGIWCAHNEPSGIYYHELTPTLYELTRKLDPSRPVIQGSGIDRDVLRSGDGHAYAGGPQDPLGHLSFHSSRERFNTEYGFGQVPPTMATIEKYYPPEERIIRRFYVTSMAGLEDTEFVAGGKTTTAGAEAVTLEGYLARMWESQATVLKYAAETMRLQKDTMAGMTEHTLTDSWPFNNYGVVDYEGFKKQPSFDAFAEANRPVHAMLEYTRRPLAIWVVNDLPKSFEDATVQWSAKPDKASALPWEPKAGKARLAVKANKLLRVADIRKDWADIEGPTVVMLELRNSSGKLLDRNEYHVDFARPHIVKNTAVLVIARPSSKSKQSAALVQALTGMGATVTECGEEVPGRAVFPKGDLKTDFDAAILMETVEAGTMIRPKDALALADAVTRGLRLIHISGAEDEVALGSWFAQVASPARLKENSTLTDLLPAFVDESYRYDQSCSRRTVEPAFDDHPVTRGLDFTESFHKVLNVVNIRDDSTVLVSRGGQRIVAARKAGEVRTASILLLPRWEDYNFQELLARLIDLDYPLKQEKATVQAPMPIVRPENGLIAKVYAIDPEQSRMWTATPDDVKITQMLQEIHVSRPALSGEFAGNNRHFAAEFAGYLYAPLDGEYRLGLRAENGAWMWLDDKPAVAAPMVKGWDSDGIPPMEEMVRLGRGFHKLRIFYFGYERLDMRHNLFLETKWRMPGFSQMEDIPTNYFFRTQPADLAFGDPHTEETSSWR